MAEPRWQTNVKSLNDGIAHIYETKEFADVDFNVGFRLFKAHLLILHARNPELAKKVLEHKRENTGKSHVILGDVSEDGFENLLHFIYTDELKYTDESFLETYRAALKYKQNSMVKKCQGIIENWEVTLENVCNLLEDAMELLALKNRCISFINNNAISVLKSDGFKLLSFTNVKEFIENGHFNHVPSAILLSSVICWAENQFEPQEDYHLVRNLLLQSEKPILGQLGIEKLTHLELTDFITKHKNLLTEKECLQFFIHAANTSAELPSWCSSGEMESDVNSSILINP